MLRPPSADWRTFGVVVPKSGLQVLLDVAGVTLTEIAHGVTAALVKNGKLNDTAANELRKVLLLHGDARRRSISEGTSSVQQGNSSRLKQSLRGPNDKRTRRPSVSAQDDDFALGKGARMAPMCDGRMLLAIVC